MSELDDTSRRILIAYLSDFLPADTNDTTSFLKSSREIQDDLEEMCEISVSDISTEMLNCNYQIVTDDDNKPKWLMSRKS